jgi:hypothetical protein
MRISIYISGITGILFFVIRIMLEFPLNKLFLISVSALLILFFLPLVIIDKHLQYKRVNKIIDLYKGIDKRLFNLRKEYQKSKDGA